MPTKIDYKAIYTPLIKILSDKELTDQNNKGVKMALDIMNTTLREKGEPETSEEA